MSPHRRSGSSSRTSAPSTSTEPPVTSNRRGRRFTTDVLVSSTSSTRSALTAARGSRMPMKVAIMTPMRICMRYCRNAMRVPTSMSPSPTRMPPNQMTATLETFITSMTAGNMRANRRPALTAVWVSSALASANRSVSWRSRTKALMTRMPVSCSRSTRLTRWMRFWMRRKSGTIRIMIPPTATRG